MTDTWDELIDNLLYATRYERARSALRAAIDAVVSKLKERNETVEQLAKEKHEATIRCNELYSQLAAAREDASTLNVAVKLLLGGTKGKPSQAIIDALDYHRALIGEGK
ncbi:hypothetical protein CCP3SC15_1920005 [Gammaproteobacteria bacterium]